MYIVTKTIITFLQPRLLNALSAIKLDPHDKLKTQLL